MAVNTVKLVPQFLILSVSLDFSISNIGKACLNFLFISLNKFNQSHYYTSH